MNLDVQYSSLSITIVVGNVGDFPYGSCCITVSVLGSHPCTNNEVLLQTDKDYKVMALPQYCFSTVFLNYDNRVADLWLPWSNYSNHYFPESWDLLLTYWV